MCECSRASVAHGEGKLKRQYNHHISIKDVLLDRQRLTDLDRCHEAVLENITAYDLIQDRIEELDTKKPSGRGIGTVPPQQRGCWILSNPYRRVSGLGSGRASPRRGQRLHRHRGLGRSVRPPVLWTPCHGVQGVQTKHQGDVGLCRAKAPGPRRPRPQCSDRQRVGRCASWRLRFFSSFRWISHNISVLPL